jgi:hypothetical protein
MQPDHEDSLTTEHEETGTTPHRDEHT